MNKFLPLIFLIGCSGNRLFKKEYITLSESPCVDGVILNIDQAGCEGFYWGTTDNGEVLKIRCTYAPKDNMWTKSIFYAVPHNHQVDYSNWFLFCEDRLIKMYSAPYGVRLEQ